MWLLPDYIRVTLFRGLLCIHMTAVEQLPDYFPNVRTCKKANTQFLVLYVYNLTWKQVDCFMYCVNTKEIYLE